MRYQAEEQAKKDAGKAVGKASYDRYAGGGNGDLPRYMKPAKDHLEHPRDQELLEEMLKPMMKAVNLGKWPKKDWKTWIKVKLPNTPIERQSPGTKVFLSFHAMVKGLGPGALDWLADTMIQLKGGGVKNESEVEEEYEDSD